LTTHKRERHKLREHNLLARKEKSAGEETELLAHAGGDFSVRFLEKGGRGVLGRIACGEK